eukprot:CAMPEP_0175897450 /NCGR_PEP_ID=MMETSP0108-20121206/724_1 /TAXON_ID=195067 ORGANISM="Goniomonas pacifica, Strain CCMP1869" /NCGR_SAMPLE_ID=MMETSP0108 /ASSEMBLY_ACC=CAM_ASM_000204 /LENGTH=195 /DNA_ID=CAMNT_0017218745 /DNA_START=83 /DNA_END=671 /DNA_ORIENTATION=-
MSPRVVLDLQGDYRGHQASRHTTPIDERERYSATVAQLNRVDIISARERLRQVETLTFPPPSLLDAAKTLPLAQQAMKFGMIHGFFHPNSPIVASTELLNTMIESLSTNIDDALADSMRALPARPKTPDSRKLHTMACHRGSVTVPAASEDQQPSHASQEQPEQTTCLLPTTELDTKTLLVHTMIKNLQVGRGRS